MLKSSADLQTSTCCAADGIPAHLVPILKELHDEVKDRLYGCGLPIPPALEGTQVLDLGCGRDCYRL